MSWRPDGWEKVLLGEIKKVPDPELVKGDLTAALMMFAEAGADAILKAIKGLLQKEADECAGSPYGSACSMFLEEKLEGAG